MDTGENILPMLREDLRIERGGCFLNGAPSWLIHDPLRNQFFRIGEATFEILSLWRGISLPAFCKLASEHLRKSIEKDDVEETIKFLYSNQLTEEPPSGSSASYYEQEKARKKGLGSTILHGYLFFKIPLFNPQSILDAGWPFVRFFFTKTAIQVFSLLAILSLYLVSRQWEVFTSTFFAFLSFEGAVFYGLSLIILKFLHEFGHAFMAKKYNVPVPVIGVAFLVLFPVLFTDTTSAVKLKDQKQRLMIDMAGILTELAIAVIATLFWIFLPDGTLRSIAFTTATLSWVLSLLVNLNSFMRFDGYYILSDALGFENLQERSFNFAKWRMREILFKPGLPPPEAVRLNLQKILVFHAWGTWIYRFFLFLGIALLVYGFFAKIIGIILFAVEIAWFIILPIWRELKNWWASRESYKTFRSILSGSVLALLILAFFMPWSSRVDIPAIYKSSNEFSLYPPAHGMLLYSNLENQKRVNQGDILIKINSPELDAELRISEKRLQMLDTRLSRSSASELELSSLSIIKEEHEAERQKLLGLREKKQSLTVKSPFDGLLVNIDRELHIDQWLAQTKSLGMLIKQNSISVIGITDAASVSRMKVGQKGFFIPDGFIEKKLPVEVKSISKIAESALEEEILSEQEGGLVPTTKEEEEKLIPHGSWFKIELSMASEVEDMNKQSITRGLVVIEAEAQSFSDRVFRQIASVLIRESGF